MARRVFFSFHYDRDIFRVNQIRHSWVTKPSLEEAGYVDKADFEKLEKEGDAAIKRWIDKQLDGTSVTVVLIGYETSSRPYVRYEIEQSYKKGNGMLGIYLNNVKTISGLIDFKGQNPFSTFWLDSNSQRTYLSQLYKTYDWLNDDGYNNIGKWIEQAAKDAGR